MRKFKSAFSLAELLLCVAIIGIVSAMGMTIAKHGADRAYDLFYYNGYISLYNAIADAIASAEEPSNQQIMTHVHDVLHSEEIESEDPEDVDVPAGWPAPGGADSFIYAVNGIKYYYPSVLNEGLNGVAAGAGVANAIPITMIVPQRKTRDNNGYAVALFAYIDDASGYLVPVTVGNSTDILNRRDLLTVYIDDGRVGRTNAVRQNTFDYQHIVYTNYRSAFCTIRGSLGNLVNCNGVERVTPRDGTLKFANPQRAR